MASPCVICFGEALLDRVTGADAASGSVSPGGAPANVACGLSKLGTSSAFMGCLGSDEPGKQLFGHLSQVGVDVSGVVHHGSAPTRIVELELDGGERKFLGFAGGAATDSFADGLLQASDLSESLFQQADYLVVGSNALAYRDSATALQRALELANDYFVKIVLDVNWRPMFWVNPEEAKAQVEALAQQVDFLKLSESDAQWLYGTTEATRILAQLEQLEAAFVTAGAKGAGYAFAAGPKGHTPAFCISVRDTTGAGDAFVAGLIHQLATHSLQKLGNEGFIAEVLRYANAAGSLATTGLGAIAPQASDAEIQAFLVGRTE